MISMNKKWKPGQVSINNEKKLIEAICKYGGEDGIILIKDLNHESLINNVPKIFNQLQSPQNKQMITKLNNAYTQNLVFKDASKANKKLYENWHHKIDQKRTLDLSPKRISVINKKDPSLLPSMGSDLSSSLNVFDMIRIHIAPKIFNALCKGSKINDIDIDSINFNYRMIDYYPSLNNNNNCDQPRCAEHVDFGLFTLIFQDETGGLQIQRSDGKWYDIKSDRNTCICLFGWCTQIMSNNRIKATKHRVIAIDDEAKRRNSAVIFVAPDLDLELRPNVESNEKKMYRNIKVNTLKERMRNAWKMREGTLSDKQFNFVKNEIKSQSHILDTIKL